MSYLLLGFTSLRGILRDDADMAARQSEPTEKHSVDIFRSKPRTRVKLQQQIRDTLSLLVFDFYRKSVWSCVFRLHNRVQNGACT